MGGDRVVIGLVFVGAVVDVLLILALSPTLREVVRTNLPSGAGGR